MEDETTPDLKEVMKLLKKYKLIIEQDGEIYQTSKWIRYEKLSKQYRPSYVN